MSVFFIQTIFYGVTIAEASETIVCASIPLVVLTIPFPFTHHSYPTTGSIAGRPAIAASPKTKVVDERTFNAWNVPAGTVTLSSDYAVRCVVTVVLMVRTGAVPSPPSVVTISKLADQLLPTPASRGIN